MSDMRTGTHSPLTKTLENSLFVVAEVSVQPRFVGSYRFEELIRAMQDHGFQVHNILSSEPDGNRIVRSLDVLFVHGEPDDDQAPS